MPEPAAAVTVALLVTDTLPATALLGWFVPPGKKPAVIAEGWEPLLLRFVPEWIVPLATTVTLVLAEAVVDQLLALMALLPELSTSPVEVVTLMLPLSRLKAWIALNNVPVIEALAPTLTAISPVPPLSSKAARPYCPPDTVVPAA